MLKNKLKWLSFPIAALLIAALLVAFMPDGGVSISSEGKLSLETHVALVANSGETIEPTFSRGGLPIRSISYNTNGHILYVEFNGLSSLSITEEDIVDRDSVRIVEVTMNALISEHLGGNGYGAVHVYSLEPLRFTTRFSKETIEGEWWQ